MPLRIVLADDHQVIREGVKALLEREGFEVVGVAVNGVEAVRMAQDLNPDIAVLDWVMPLLSGVDAGEQILRACPRTRALLLTTYTNDYQVSRALQVGIRGYVVKSQAAEDLIKAIRAVTRGEIYLSPGISKDIADSYLQGTERRLTLSTTNAMEPGS